MAENQRSNRRYPYTTNKRARQACENCRSVRTEKSVCSVVLTTNTNAAARSQNAQERDLIVRVACDYGKDAYMPLSIELAKDLQSLETTPVMFLKQLVPTM